MTQNLRTLVYESLQISRRGFQWFYGIHTSYDDIFRFPGQELINQLQDTTYSIYVILVFDIILFILTLFHFGTASTIDPGIIPR